MTGQVLSDSVSAGRGIPRSVKPGAQKVDWMDASISITSLPTAEGSGPLRSGGYRGPAWWIKPRQGLSDYKSCDCSSDPGCPLRSPCPQGLALVEGPGWLPA